VLDVVDAQVHVFAEDAEPWPWDQALYAQPAAAAMVARYAGHVHRGTIEALVAAMDAHGVHGALAVAPAIHGFDPSYSVEAWRRHPDRFRVVGRVDAAREDADDLLAAWGEDPAFVGLRLSLGGSAAAERFLAGGDDRMLAAAARCGLTVCVNAPGRFDLQRELARRHPDLPLVIDHLGLFDIPMLDPAYGDTFAGLDGLLALAPFEQVAVKLTSIPLLSREPYPHADAWPHLHRVLAAFGPGRCMWGSDGTVFDHDLGEAVDVIRATDELGLAEKEQILGGTLRRVWNWPAA
jgi:L-fuconolactonase